jgi:hypothetical protein
MLKIIVYLSMKKKATTRKLTVRNSEFAAAVRQAVAGRAHSHDRVIDKVRSTGIVEKLVEANKAVAAK